MSISFIVPCYHAEKTLPTLIASFLGEANADDALLLVFDGLDQDASVEVAKQASAGDPRIQIHYPKKRMGAFGARKYGIGIVTTSHTGFADADDSFPVGSIQKIHELIQTHPVTILNYSFHVKKPSGGHDNAFTRKEGTLSKEEAFQGLLKDSYIRGFLWTKVFETSFLKQLTIIKMEGEDALFEDVIFNACAFLEAASFYYCPQPLYNYHQMGMATAVRKQRVNRAAYHIACFASIRAILEKKSDQRLLSIFFASALRSRLSLWYDLTQDRKFGLKWKKRRALLKVFRKVFDAKVPLQFDPLYIEYIDKTLL